MKSIKKSMIINVLIIVFVIIASIFMFTGFRFMPGKFLLSVTKIEMLKFFTVQSNILMAIISAIFLVYERKILNKEIKEIPKGLYKLKLIGTSAITLTFLVTLLFLSPMYGFYNMYNNSNLFYHFMVPVLSIISYILYEKECDKYSYAFYGIVPTFIYSIYYILEIVIHLNNGGLTFKYDFYGFLQGNINNAFFVVPGIYFVSFLIALVLILLNKKFKRTK